MTPPQTWMPEGADRGIADALGHTFRGIAADFSGWSPRLSVAHAVMAGLPLFAGNRIRALALRAAGFSVGDDTVILGPIKVMGAKRPQRHLFIGGSVTINFGCFFDVSGGITIGDDVGVGQQVGILTGAHPIGPGHRRMGPVGAQPVTVGSGAWLSTRCLILPGNDVGEGAVVGAGAVVTRPVPPHTLVAGVPARVVRQLL